MIDIEYSFDQLQFNSSGSLFFYLFNLITKYATEDSPPGLAVITLWLNLMAALKSRLLDSIFISRTSTQQIAPPAFLFPIGLWGWFFDKTLLPEYLVSSRPLLLG